MSSSVPTLPSPVHIALVGDSIFDNGVYVADNSSVSDHLRRHLSTSSSSKVTLLARDGATLSGVPSQLSRLPDTTTHVFISAGGNDALGEMHRLREKTNTLRDALVIIGKIRSSFEKEYRAAVKLAKSVAPLSEAGHPRVTVCNIYNPRPDAGGVPLMHPSMAGRDDGNAAWNNPEQIAMEVGLSVFNDVITSVAADEGVPVINVRGIFSDAADYATPIEPSSKGGNKLAQAIVRVAAEGSFSGKCSIYGVSK
ncbi:hypothetical protein HK104_007877 [Borealophlyctis nickersoniae]|nr:hypothetical protein HK104_007877 [Borealophlyctis nickersoniae]